MCGHNPKKGVLGTGLVIREGLRCTTGDSWELIY